MKIKKIIVCLLILILISSIVTLNYSKATTLGDIISSAKNAVKSGDNQNALLNQTKLKETSDTIYNILLSIGIIVAIIFGAFLGLQFIMQSAEGKAKISEALVPYIIGCVVVFGAFTIWKIAIKIGGDVTDDDSIVQIKTQNCLIAEENIEEII